jgi:hypothetical protein
MPMSVITADELPLLGFRQFVEQELPCGRRSAQTGHRWAEKYPGLVQRIGGRTFIWREAARAIARGATLEEAERIGLAQAAAVAAAPLASDRAHREPASGNCRSDAQDVEQWRAGT